MVHTAMNFLLNPQIWLGWAPHRVQLCAIFL